MLPAVSLCVLLAVVGVRSHSADARAGHLAESARQLDLVGGMRASLLAASDRERSAVLAVSDEASRTFADQARASIADLDRQSAELAALLSQGHPRAAAQLAALAKPLADFRKLDDEVLTLAVQNTNLKAYQLAFGPAAEAVGQLDAALQRIANAPSASKEISLAAARALIAALRIQALLPPHIAEESDAKMSALEARMGEDDAEARRQLDGLASARTLRDSAEVAAARAAYSSFDQLRTRILQLSRANTNVRSLSLTLDQHRGDAMRACLDALRALQDAVQSDVPSAAAPLNPRRL